MLATYIDGAPWEVTYYKQVIGADNGLNAYDPSRKAPFQQYEEISGLEILVTAPLSSSQEAESKEFATTGAAVAYGYPIPNQYDLFTATVDDGRQAYFTVTSSEKATYKARSVYLIEYKLLAYVEPIMQADLASKTVEKYQFVKSLLEAGQNPLMPAQQWATYTSLNQLYVDLVSMYFRDFFSGDYQTLLVPDQPQTTYDHFLTRAMVDLVDTDDSLTLPKIRLPAVEGDRAMVNVTVWDALLRTNKSLLVTGLERMSLMWTANFRNYPALTGIYYKGLQQVVYPLDTRTDVDAFYHTNPVPSGSLANDGTLRYSSLERTLREKDTLFFKLCDAQVERQAVTQPGALPVIVPVTRDDYYVFTEGFYGVTGAQLASQLEKLVRQAIENQALDPLELAQVGAQAFGWPNLERFYYIPALLALIKITLRSN